MQDKKEYREQMMLMIEDWQSSGLKQCDYCAVNNNKLAYHVFHYWYGVYGANKTDTEFNFPTLSPGRGHCGLNRGVHNLS